MLLYKVSSYSSRASSATSYGTAETSKEISVTSLYRPTLTTARKRSCGKVMFLHLSVILFTRGFLSMGSLSTGVSVQGGSLSRGVSVQGLSVQWSVCRRESLSRGSLSGRPPTAVRLRAGITHPTGMHSCIKGKHCVLFHLSTI